MTAKKKQPANPWEETWFIGETKNQIEMKSKYEWDGGIDSFSIGEFFDFAPNSKGYVSDVPTTQDRKRARLAVCAPEMARLLLKLEYAGDDDQCKFCGNIDPPDPEGPYADCNHESDCEWLAVMKKAGIR